MLVRYTEDMDYEALINFDNFCKVDFVIGEHSTYIRFIGWETMKADFKAEIYGAPDGKYILDASYYFPGGYRIGENRVEVDEEIAREVFEKMCAAIAAGENLFDIDEALDESIHKRLEG